MYNVSAFLNASWPFFKSDKEALIIAFVPWPLQCRYRCGLVVLGQQIKKLPGTSTCHVCHTIQEAGYLPCFCEGD